MSKHKTRSHDHRCEEPDQDMVDDTDGSLLLEVELVDGQLVKKWVTRADAAIADAAIARRSAR